MPLSKEDTQKALSILESILNQLEENEPHETDADNVDDIMRIQHLVDVMRSPLFTTLVEVRNKYEQTIDSSSLDSAQATDDSLSSTSLPTSHEVKLDKETDLELQAQFRQSYEIPSSVIQNGHARNGSITSEEFDEDLSTTTSVAGSTPRQQISSSSIARNDVEFHSTFVTSVNGSPSPANGQSNYKSKVKNRKDSTGSGSSDTSLSRLAKRFVIGRKKSAGSNASVSLADLARFTPRGQSSESEMKTMVGSEFKGDTGIPHFVRRLTTSSESSLSSMSSESVPLVKSKPIKDSSVLKYPPHDGSLVLTNEGTHCEEEVDGSKDDDDDKMDSSLQQARDVLFFMRDKQSQTKIQEILQNREPRDVNMVMHEGWTGDGRGCEGLGVDLVGLSSTGVFVANVHRTDSCNAESAKMLRQGDQIMEINGTKIKNMASFEVDLLLSDIAVGSNVHLVVKHNPSGLADYQRLTKR